MTEHPNCHVEFRNVTKRYGAVTVVRDLNLSVRRGEFLTLLGPSGSGKTTSLLMLAGFEEVSEGAILIDGEQVQDKPAAKRNIGMVFQNYALFPHMTVAENIAFSLKVRRMPKASLEKQVAAVVDKMQLHGLEARRPSQISGGQQQRVALARALVFNPQLVLMDEPLGALDKRLRDHMQMEIKRLHREFGITIVYVTHDQSEAMTMSDRVVVFHDGAIQQVGPPDEIYDRPRTSFVAQFVGENNQLKGVTVGVSDIECAVEVASGIQLRARPSENTRVGAQTMLSVRPECITVNPPPTPEINTMPAQIIGIVYLGDHVRIRARLADGVEITVRLPDKSSAALYSHGQKILLGWSVNDCYALDS